MRRGALVHLVGPDGTGKSTLAALVVEALRPHGPVLHRYWRPAILPSPRRFAGRPEGEVVTDPHGRPPQRGFRASLRVLYYAVDFLVGHWILYRPVLRRGGVVVVERGWQDVAVDPRRYLLPTNRLALALLVLMPKPDLLFVLDAPAGVVRARKPELEPVEIERQLGEWLRRGRTRRLVRLDATLPADRLAHDVVGVVSDTLSVSRG
ncbi:MAG TPA: hypothetical protein VHC67_10055 [Gaiellaceae bacterium]|nr:hypothetical protein [Gaiellaceae bacterium]